MAAGVDLEGLLPPLGHEDVEVLRIGGNAIHRAALAPELAHDHPHHGAVIVDDLGDIVRPNILIARLGHLQMAGQVGPELKSVHLPLGVSFGHFLMQDARACGHPLHIATLQRAPVAKAVTMVD